jgi:hypothetical protein
MLLTTRSHLRYKYPCQTDLHARCCTVSGSVVIGVDDKSLKHVDHQIIQSYWLYANNRS